jgi:hypothetical protein
VARSAGVARNPIIGSRLRVSLPLRRFLLPSFALPLRFLLIAINYVIRKSAGETGVAPSAHNRRG